MKILQMNRRILSVTGMCSLANGIGFRFKFCQTICAVLVLIGFILIEWYSVLFCLEHYRMGDLDHNLFAVEQLIGNFPSFASFISLVYQMKSVRDCLKRIQKVCDKCNLQIEFLKFFFHPFK